MAPAPKSGFLSPLGDGGPAFPDVHEGQTGMSLRDYFAGQALAGLRADERLPKDTARIAYEIADGMLAVRKEMP